jgi:hypothetical protein
MFQLFDIVSDDKKIKSISSSDVLPAKVLNIVEDVKNNKDKAFIIQVSVNAYWYCYDHNLTRIYKDTDGNDKKICSIISFKKYSSLFFILENNMEVTISYTSDEKIAMKVNNHSFLIERTNMKWIDPK